MLNRREAPCRPLPVEYGPERWAGYLPHVIRAPEEGDIDRARAVKDTYGPDFKRPKGNGFMSPGVPDA